MFDAEIDKRCEAGHPNQCQMSTATGQCRFEAIEGTSFCRRHGGHHRHKSNMQAAEREYIAAQWRAQVGVFADSPDIKSLRTEIGVLRMMMIKHLNSCKSDQDLMMRSSSIADLATKVEKAVTACDRLDNRLGRTLDKAQLLIFGQQVITLVSKYLESPDSIREFASELVQAIEDAGNPLAESDPIASRV
jgi:hypothetical protein